MHSNWLFLLGTKKFPNVVQALGLDGDFLLSLDSAQ